MRKIVQSVVAAALIATSAAQAAAAAPQHHKAAQTSASEQLRNARNAMEQTSEPGLRYSGWSAPAGR
jgi:hypothetical protein